MSDLARRLLRTLEPEPDPDVEPEPDILDELDAWYWRRRNGGDPRWSPNSDSELREMAIERLRRGAGPRDP